MHHTQMMRLRHKLGEDADCPKYIFSEPDAGYRMPKGEARDPRGDGGVLAGGAGERDVPAGRDQALLLLCMDRGDHGGQKEAWPLTANHASCLGP